MSLALFGVFSFALTMVIANFGRAPQTAYAVTASTINFQARLQTAAGGIVPDGNYNVEFKLYDSSAAGTADQGTCSGDSHCVWVETRTGGNKVNVTNGYLNVQLGSVTAFGAGIDWSQPLWMTMNIGGTSTASWDGEMTPSLPLTAVPYAFQAGRAATADQLSKAGVTYTSTLGIQAPTGGNQTFQIQDQGAAGTYNILTAPSGSDGYVKLQSGTPSVQSGKLAIDGSVQAGSIITDTVGTTGATDLNFVTGGTTRATIAADGSAMTLIGTGTDGAGATLAFGSDGLLSISSLDDTSNVGLAINAYAQFQVRNNDGEVSFSLDTQNGAASVTAVDDAFGGFTVSKSNGHQVLSVSTADAGSVTIGYAGDTAATLFVLDSDATVDPSGTEGAMYYNSSLNRFRCYENGDWVNCTGNGSLVQGGNSFGAAADLGTTDSNDLNLLTDGTARVTIAADGSAVTLGSGTGLTVQGGDINTTGNYKAGGTTIINSSGKLQDAGFDSSINYSNLQKVTDLTASSSITIGSTGSGGLLTNNGATLNTAKSLGDITGASIGTAADTVDAFTSFTITQTTSSITASIPAPTDTTAGRVIYVANLGTSTQSITVGGILLSPGNSSSFFWNGSTWAATAVSTGVSVVGSFSNSGISDGASISGNTLTLGSADATHPGMVNTTAQTLQGAKTFSSLLTGSAGLTVSGGAVSLTGNAASSLTTSSGALTLTSAAAATWGTNSGALTLQGTDGVTVSSTNSAISIDSGTGTIGIGTGAQARSINIGTGAAAQTVTIGSTNSTSSLALLAGSGNINIGSVGSSTASSTIHIGDTTDATGSQTVVIGSSAANSSNATIIKGGSGSSVGSEAIRILTANAGAIAIGGSGQTGSITLGQSSATNTIYMGSAIGNGNTQTILIGNNTFGTGVTNVTVGSLIGASGTTVYSGSGSITLQTNGGTSATTGTIVKSSTNNSTGAFQVQNASNVAIFNVDTTNSTITIGSGTSTYTFSSTGLLIGTGAQHTKTIGLSAEYAGAVLDSAGDSSCSSANVGTMTSGYDGTNYQNYYKWVSIASAQCYDVVVRVALPADFAGWATGTPLTIKTYSSAHSTGLVNVDVHDTSNASVTGCVYQSATPGSDSTWTTAGSNCDMSTGTYAAGGTVTLRIRMTGNSSSDVRIGDVVLSYKSQF